jgi:hypothetical protein
VTISHGLYFLIGFLSTVLAQNLSPHDWRFWASGVLAGCIALKAKLSKSGIKDSVEVK